MLRLRYLVFLLPLVALYSGFASAQSPQATHVSLADVDATLAKAPLDRVSDQQIRHVDAGHGYLGVGVLHRPVKKAGTELRAIQHHKQSEMYHVLTGSGTLVTSSTMSDSTPIDPNGNTVRQLTGPSSRGVIVARGQRRLIKKGDIVIIPAGVAHGFSEITEPIQYLVFRIDPEKLVELK